MDEEEERRWIADAAQEEAEEEAEVAADQARYSGNRKRAREHTDGNQQQQVNYSLSSPFSDCDVLILV